MAHKNRWYCNVNWSNYSFLQYSKDSKREAIKHGIDSSLFEETAEYIPLVVDDICTVGSLFAADSVRKFQEEYHDTLEYAGLLQQGYVLLDKDNKNLRQRRCARQKLYAGGAINAT